MSPKRPVANATLSPSDSAEAYVSRLLEAVDFLTAAFVAYSGRKPVTGPPRPGPFLFEDYLQMRQAGFEPVTLDFADLAAPTIGTVEAHTEPEFVGQAYRVVTTFLFVYSYGAALKHFKREHAYEFTGTLLRVVGERCAAKYGFSTNPQEVRDVISQLADAVRCDRVLNFDSFGHEDGLGLILSRLAVSHDGRSQRAFVVGSRSHAIGCGTTLVAAVGSIDASLEACAKELGW